MTSGGIPSFLDLVANFNSQQFGIDNLIHQFTKKQKKVYFFGDDTWLKIFPSSFARSEGTTSFLVTDTMEVDHNVTRNVYEHILGMNFSADLIEEDRGEEYVLDWEWDVIVLHYLGLDHIGHWQGPLSPLMGPKQSEMDYIIKKIWEAILSKGDSHKTLFVVAGDHGMNKFGNHGGSSEEETSAAMLFISPHFQNITHGVKQVDQIDFASTIALLFNLPIPKNSLGYMISDLFSGYSDEEILYALETNCGQFLRLLKSNPGMWRNGKPNTPQVQNLLQRLEEAKNLHNSWIQKRESSLFNLAKKTYLEVF
uniref:GPI ethanolamine phosphate transferase 2 n=1 Tax=Arcella intermedia TaxID=1963864 RepID=A0A6B2LAP8_9EUKA